MSSRFLSAATAALTPYSPGEQPREGSFVKLNTNECPYPPSPKVAQALCSFDSGSLRRYPDPDARALTAALAKEKGLAPEEALACGGSDEALAFAFMAFFDRGDAVCFPDVTYGFYRVYTDLFALKAVEIPLREDFSLLPEDYFGAPGGMFLANPNAPTGLALAPEQIEEILRANRDRLVVVDEAYADYAPRVSCAPLVRKYENLLVVQTFSKSRALAGMRLGAAFGNAALVEGMRRVKYSFNPYNLDQVSIEVGLAALEDAPYLREITQKVIATRERAAARLREMGFTGPPSSANFFFVRHPRLSGRALYKGLRERGVLVRHFAGERTADFIRVSIGTDAEMDVFLEKAGELL